MRPASPFKAYKYKFQLKMESDQWIIERFVVNFLLDLNFPLKMVGLKMFAVLAVAFFVIANAQVRCYWLGAKKILKFLLFWFPISIPI